MEISTRDQQMLRLREKVIFDSEKAGEEERFQGEVLRPVLKAQNELLLLTMRHYFSRRGKNWNDLPESEWKLKVTDCLRNDQQLRLELLGLVTGLFTQAEYVYTITNRDTISRRIYSLLTERIVSQRAYFLAEEAELNTW